MSWLRTLFTVKKTLLITVGSIVVVAGLTAGGVFAYFSNQVSTTPNTFAAGNIKLSAGETFTVEWNVDHIKPGWGMGEFYAEGLSNLIEITNTGTNAFNYSVMYEKTPIPTGQGENSLWTCDADDANSPNDGFAELMISMDIVTDNGNEVDTVSSNPDDPGDNATTGRHDYGQGVGTNAPGVENYIKPGQSETVQFWARLPKCSGNECQDLSGTVKITFIAFQHEYLDVSVDTDPEWRDNVDWSGNTPAKAMVNYVHLENKDTVNWSPILNDGIEGHVKYLDDAALMENGNSYLTGIVQAYGLEPDKQYQLKIASKTGSEAGKVWPGLGTACANPSTAVPGYQPAYECNGPLGTGGTNPEYYWVIDLDAAPNAKGEINQAFQVRGNLADGTYGDYDYSDPATSEPVGILFRVNEATNNGWYKAVLMDDNNYNTAPDAMEFTLR
jgi:predicted ribosomally synthesized peptide with SipW-like signal peptide